MSRRAAREFLMTGPALEVLLAADAATAAGEDDEGFLSERWGLLPASPPCMALPASHQPWDEIAARLPHLFRTLTVRGALERLPMLEAGPDVLPDRYVWRACSLLGMFAHSYVRVKNDRSPPIPAAVQRPWAVLCKRLHRDETALTYDDLILYNWRLRDPGRPECRTLDNLDLLTPTVGNQEERIFLLTQADVAAVGAPAVGALARAQAAAMTGDQTALEAELVVLLDTLERVVRSFLKIDPNPYSDTFVDPVVWAKTVAPFAVQINEGSSYSISGAAAPIFQLLDVFIGRRQYHSIVGRLAKDVRPGFSPRMRAFQSALESFPVGDKIVNEGSPAVRGLWRSVLNAYFGRDGFLGVHRKKAFAYLELAFKVGRSVTTGGFTGLFEEQSWEVAHAELEESRQERTDVPVTGCPVARPHAQARGSLTAPGIAHVVLDLTGAGARYQPGDRLALLPKSREELVTSTLRALLAKGNEQVHLDGHWIAALRDLSLEQRTIMPLAELLSRGRLRPVSRPAAKALAAITGSQALSRIVNARAEGKWELWDLIDLAAAGSFDPRELWRADPWEPYSICKLVPPEEYRFYSISSAPDKNEHIASRAELLVAELKYRTEDSAVSREQARLGTASSFIRGLVGSDAQIADVPVRTVPALWFRLPEDPMLPIVMFAGGAGMAPFRGFIAARAAILPQPPETWLFLSTRSEEHLALQRAELSEHIAAGWLRVAFSVTGGPGARTGASGIGAELMSRASTMLDLVRSRAQGGRGAHFYICGAAGFASAAGDALESALKSVLPDADPATGARMLIRRLIGTGRYQQDVFSSHRAESTPPALLDASVVAMHNDDEHGYWMINDGAVYDITEFSHRHPGGLAIMIEHAGRDATRSYQTIEHHLNPEIEAMLGMYRVGVIRRLDFGSKWAVTVGPKGLAVVSLHDVFRAWVRMLYMVVEVQNAIRHDFAILDSVTVVGDLPETMTPLKARLLLEAHQRFLTIYIPSLLGNAMDELWTGTLGLAAPDEDVTRMRRNIKAAMNNDAARAVQASLAQDWISVEQGELGRMNGLRQIFEEADGAFLSAMKTMIASGVSAFERSERQTAQQSGRDLVATASAVPSQLVDLYSRLQRSAAASTN